ncbi:TlpA disulfide reductase family protein [Porphyromonas circumdentaria]|uniref:TlpA disulfide reductase family protein n=1 Tax=Porphyromonas circumdentaria TaxID=29524 RepID=UPI0026DAFC9E|nr:TlpA disulfide reductase family protein [Porphyromonas circumdentaria]MDO4721755.1 TlpA disulfide reductase family protein [Porphyromonas circumdentaria]
MKKISIFSLLLLSVALFIISCRNKNVIKATFPQELIGSVVYIYDVQNDSKIDSLIVEETSFEMPFTPEKEVRLLQILVGNQRTYFVPEKGVLLYNHELGVVTGTPLNESITAFIQGILSSLKGGAEHKELFAQSKEFFLAHKDTQVGGIGLEFALSFTEEVTPFHELLQQASPVILALPRMARIKKTLDNLEKTQPGKKFIDFEGTDKEGNKISIGEYLAQGQYVLVDFWASWCRPCRREIPFLKKVYDKYRNKGLAVLGVSVWEKKLEDHLKAVEELGISWPQLIDSQDIATELYGIAGIPQIMLVAPDGTIVARDLGQETIEAAVAPLFEKK